MLSRHTCQLLLISAQYHRKKTTTPSNQNKKWMIQVFITSKIKNYKYVSTFEQKIIVVIFFSNKQKSHRNIHIFIIYNSSAITKSIHSLVLISNLLAETIIQTFLHADRYCRSIPQKFIEISALLIKKYFSIRLKYFYLKHCSMDESFDTTDQQQYIIQDLSWSMFRQLRETVLESLDSLSLKDQVRLVQEMVAYVAEKRSSGPSQSKKLPSSVRSNDGAARDQSQESSKERSEEREGNNTNLANMFDRYLRSTKRDSKQAETHVQQTRKDEPCMHEKKEGSIPSNSDRRENDSSDIFALLDQKLKSIEGQVKILSNTIKIISNLEFPKEVKEYLEKTLEQKIRELQEKSLKEGSEIKKENKEQRKKVDPEKKIVVILKGHKKNQTEVLNATQDAIKDIQKRQRSPTIASENQKRLESPSCPHHAIQIGYKFFLLTKK